MAESSDARTGEQQRPAATRGPGPTPPPPLRTGTAPGRAPEAAEPEPSNQEGTQWQQQKVEEGAVPERLSWNAVIVTQSDCDPSLISAGSVWTLLSQWLTGHAHDEGHTAFLRFQKEVVAKQDLLRSDLARSQAALCHEKKLEQELRKVCVCDPRQFNKLQVLAAIFEDVCNSSLLFGDILREVKNEYELYMAILLKSPHTAQYQSLLAQVQELEKWSLRSAAIGQAKEELRALVKATKVALEHNDKLRSELEEERGLLQSAQDISGECCVAPSDAFAVPPGPGVFTPGPQVTASCPSLAQRLLPQLLPPRNPGFVGERARFTTSRSSQFPSPANPF
ncbi:uncharacterized protein C6orf118-like [Pteropus vampyrus]|uniref:Uncharacterized protein C6orf118-like n=1 Tax=Pteropus vampyrus TaxID=132908 RepID=A0A6P6BM97_PTEVA|nr:uncharacterized protein C6orf118-like [Pteropus vampyrus]